MAEPVTSIAITKLVNRALNSERGVRVHFPTRGLALNWRQRYYAVRREMVRKDPNTEWRVLSCTSPRERTLETLCPSCAANHTIQRWSVDLIPLDQQLEEPGVVEDL